MKVLVTGAAGFIGFHLIECLVCQDIEIIGLDNLNCYYDVYLKLDRLAKCGIVVECEKKLVISNKYRNYTFVKADLCDKLFIDKLFEKERFDLVINLAAQAGVRYSIINPYEYLNSNLVGFLNLLEACRNSKCLKFIYASSSSVYGNSNAIPFNEEQNVDKPISFYAATKKSNELMANVYAELFGINSIGLRFFTVYGPWGRPDMAPMLFADAIAKGKSIKVFNNGNLSRDFTFIEDIVKGIMNVIKEIDSVLGAEVYNIGHGSPVQLLRFIKTIECYMGKEAIKEYVGMQAGDVAITFADTTKFAERLNYSPLISLDEGVSIFIDWIQKIL